MSDDEPVPTAALIVSLLAATLVLLDGAALLLAGGALSTAGFYDAAGLASLLGVAGLLFGFVLLGLAIQLYREPMSSGWCGVGILVVSLLALVSGGGFFLGTVLGVIGGILAIVFGRAQEEDTYGPAPQPLPPGPGWTCRSCGRNNPQDSWYCAGCGQNRPAAGAAGTA